MTTPLLAVNTLEVVYNRAITAVQGVSFGVEDRSITALIGTNGAGKTTTLRAIGGFMRAENVAITQGDVAFEGVSIRGLRNDQVSARGIALVPEREKIFPTLTVGDNIAACMPKARRPALMGRDEVFGLFPVLAARRTQVAGYLSGGERQMLAISMALLTSPRIILIDEMTLGLSPAIVAELQTVVRRLRDELGLTVLVVEQNAAVALELADYVYVMENGRIVFDGTPDHLRGHADFRDFYLGMAASGAHRSYRDVKQYQRKRRWFG